MCCSYLWPQQLSLSLDSFILSFSFYFTFPFFAFLSFFFRSSFLFLRLFVCLFVCYFALSLCFPSSAPTVCSLQLSQHFSLTFSTLFSSFLFLSLAACSWQISLKVFKLLQQVQAPTCHPLTILSVYYESRPTKCSALSCCHPAPMNNKF
jgi:hypothetical protein